MSDVEYWIVIPTFSKNNAKILLTNIRQETGYCGIIIEKPSGSYLELEEVKE